MILLDDSFWRMDLGRLLECCVFGATFLIGKAMDSQKKSDKIDEHSQWIADHKKEDEKRDEILDGVTQSLTRLTTIQESNEYRLRNLEVDVKEIQRS